jgi:hypothetical protein
MAQTGKTEVLMSGMSEPGAAKVTAANQK